MSDCPECSFCRGTELLADEIIAAPDNKAFICNLCVDACVYLIAEKRLKKKQDRKKETETCSKD